MAKDDRAIQILIKYGLDQASVEQIKKKTLSVEDAIKKVSGSLDETTAAGKETGQILRQAMAVAEKGADETRDAIEDLIASVDTSTAAGRRFAKALKSSLQETEKAAEDAGNKSKKSFLDFNKILETASGVILANLISKFLEFSQLAIAKFQEIKAQSLELNSNLEQARIQFGSIFGNEQDAETFIKYLRQISTEIGASTDEATQFAKSLVPDTTSQDQFERLIITAQTAAKDANLKLEDARFAFEEVISGDFTSLKERLNIPKSTIERIKELQKEYGQVEGLILGLNERFEKTGASIEKFGDTGAAASAQVSSKIQDLIQAFGETPFEAQKERAQALNEVLSANAEDYTLIAQRLGDVVGAIDEFVTSGLVEFLQDIDPEPIQELLDSLYGVVQTGGLLTQFIGQAYGNFGQFGGIVDALNLNLKVLDFFLKIISGTLEITNATVAAGVAYVNNLANSVEYFLGYTDKLEQVSPFEAFNQSISESNQLITDYTTRLAEDNKRLDERKKKAEEAAGAQNKVNFAFDQGAQASKEYEKALKKVNEAEAKLDEQSLRATADLQTDITRKRLDIERDNSREREKIAQDNADKIEDIYRKSQDDLADAAKDAGRKQQDIERDYGRDLAKIDTDLANNRVDIERDYRRRLDDIQRDFERSTEEAVLNQDVGAFLAAQRQRDQAIEDAQTGRQQQTEDAKVDAERQREALKASKEQEIEDAKIANERKLEDLRANLEQQLEEERIANERKLEEQQISEQTKADDLAVWIQQRIEDQQMADERRREDLQTSLADELEIVKKAEEEKTKIILDETEKRIKAYNKAIEAAREAGSATAGNPNDPTFLTPGRASGGYVGSGIYQLGEQGREYVLNNQTTTALEDALGQSLTQGGVMSLATGNRSATANNTFNFPPGLDEQRIVNMAMARMEDSLMRIERGFE